MSRPLKFRAWMESAHRMVYFPGPMIDLDTPYLMQFTGLHDRHGKEIYEGDVVRFETLDPQFNREEVGEIVYRRFGFIAHIPNVGDKQFYDPMVEILGNIHEHQELLTVQEGKGE